ncbi:sensor histidine kinase [Motilimonas cestriensis]|uniref:histidine kinase n=1 Tax=Motilimonas cestriensis TaxID=2742685 RepID=A0ABS8W6C1_9GAMM|nr:sensor histidine kinase [Motilimonas cestriensis]MCE2593637.1 sensor histidine kinase [Motilimonas cestriensis]
MALIISLIQQLSVFLVIAYLFSKTPIFKPLVSISVSLPHKVVIYLVFSSFCIMGTYFGLAVQDAIANTRAVGAVLGGLLGGPVVGFLVGLTGGLHRYSMGGFTDVACAISTTLEGLMGGLLHLYIVRKRNIEALFSPLVAFFITLAAEAVQMAVILVVAKPFTQAWQLVTLIAPPMLIANALGAALFMHMIRDQKAMFDKFSSAFSAKAMLIAERTVGIMAKGLTQQSAEQIANIILEETKVGAVAVTDKKQILAFTGIGHQHHKPGRVISSPLTLSAIKDNKIVFADGVNLPYQCSVDKHCRLGSAIIIPLRIGDGEVVGTIKLYEPKHKLFLNINRTLGEGIAKLLSNQILFGQFLEQKRLLTESELKLIHAQINPHFLFNALNTISAVTRTDPDKARELLLSMSHFFRKNLKRSCDITRLEEELKHVEAYLAIERARFGDRLDVKITISPDDYSLRLPCFTLQPIIENAIKHGTSHLLEAGCVTISLTEHQEQVCLCVQDNAGLYRSKTSDGLGLDIVDKRIKNAYGQDYGLSIECEPNVYTKVNIYLPKTTAKTIQEPSA